MPHLLHVVLALEAMLPEAERGFRLRGLLFELLGEDSGYGRQLHEAPINPFALKVGFAVENYLKFKVAVLDEASLPIWRELLATGRSFSSKAGLSGQVLEVEETGEPYQELREHYLTGAAPEKVRLNFLSPTAVSAACQEWAVPMPRYIWGGLRKRWNAFSGLPLQEDLANWLEVHMCCTTYRTRRAIAELGKNHLKVFGFTGRAIYKLSGDPGLRRWAGLLAAYAEYAGVGTRTAYGCGEVSVKVQAEASA